MGKRVAYIFGAGASRGAQSTSGVSAAKLAPLVDDLFDGGKYRGYTKWILDNPEWGACHDEVVRAGGSVERWLDGLWAERETLTPQARRTLESRLGCISIYIRQVLQGVSESSVDPDGYHRFLRSRLESGEDFQLLTFNYDTLLDQAIQDVQRIQLGSLEAYREAFLYKLHGSVNWFLPPLPVTER